MTKRFSDEARRKISERAKEREAKKRLTKGFKGASPNETPAATARRLRAQEAADKKMVAAVSDRMTGKTSTKDKLRSLVAAENKKSAAATANDKAKRKNAKRVKGPDLDTVVAAGVKEATTALARISPSGIERRGGRLPVLPTGEGNSLGFDIREAEQAKADARTAAPRTSTVHEGTFGKDVLSTQAKKRLGELRDARAQMQAKVEELTTQAKVLKDTADMSVVERDKVFDATIKNGAIHPAGNDVKVIHEVSTTRVKALAELADVKASRKAAKAALDDALAETDRIIAGEDPSGTIFAGTPEDAEEDADDNNY